MNTPRKQILLVLTSVIFLFIALFIVSRPVFAQEEDATAAKLAKQKQNFEQRVAREFGAKFSVHETKHWLIASDASGETVKGCGETLEKCYRLYFKLMKDIMGAKELADKRMLAFIFSEEGPKRAYYAPSACAIFVSMRHSRGHRTLFHEATHQLQYERSKGRTPTWLVEGLAMYFESFVEIAEGRAQKTKNMVPMYLGNLKKSVREKEHVKVFDLVNSTHSQFHSGLECLKYCESGALVHYLIFGKKGAYCDKFKDFIQGKGKDDLYAHIGIDKNQLEKEFLAYVPELLNYSDKLLVTFKERWQIAHQDVSTPEFRLCLARVLRVKGSFDEARRELEKAALKDKEGKYKTRIKYEEGVIYYYEGKWRKARKVLEEVSGKMKNNPQLFYFLADTCRQLDDLPASVKYYEKSVEVEPDFFAARYEVALIYLQQDKTKKAIKHLEACTKLKPVTWTKLSEFGLDFQISNIREMLATAYLQDRQYGKAITELEEYLKESASPTGYYHLAFAYSKTGKKKEALDALDTGLAFLKPELEKERKRLRHRRRTATFKTSVLNAMLDLYLALGKEDKALSVLELLKKYSGDTVQLHATMAKLYAKQGKTAEVLEEVDKIVELKPNDSFHIEDVAIALKKLKEYKTSEKVYKKALEVEPKNQYLLFNFGVMYWSWKKYGKALVMWEKALAIDPGFTQAENWAKKARNKLKQK